MIKEYFEAFNPMDPLDLAIMTDPTYDHTVDELDKYTESAGMGRESALSEAYEPGIAADQFEADDDNNVGYDDNDSIDMPADYASEDAEDFSAAEMELLAGDFGNPVDAIDTIEFIGAE